MNRSSNSTPLEARSYDKAFISGGAGFIGTNLAHSFLSKDRPVILYDNLSGPDAEENLRWLKETHGDLVEVVIADLRDSERLGAAISRAAYVYDFACQTEVHSAAGGRVNAADLHSESTSCLLEALRSQNRAIPLIFGSSCEVYGEIEEVELTEQDLRYEAIFEGDRRHGISESRRQDFHSVCGRSLAVNEQYVLDYANTYHLPATVLRMSCIYGPHQQGNAHQGWVSHMLRQALKEDALVIQGDGKQVCDILHVEDLVHALLLGLKHIGGLTGKALNVGGGPKNAVSLLELLEFIAARTGKSPPVEFSPWPEDARRYFASDNRRFSGITGWIPRVSVAGGVLNLFRILEAEVAAEAEHEHTESEHQQEPVLMA